MISSRVSLPPRAAGPLRLCVPAQKRVQCLRAVSIETQQQIEQVVQQLRVGSTAEQGLREGMEDELHVAFNPTHGYLYAGCYDGHGGAAAAQWLKANLLDVITSYAKSAGDLTENNQSIPNVLSQAFEGADQKLLTHLESLGGEELAQAGSTATVVLLWRSRVVVANVGDSQAYIWRKISPVSLTTPHRVYGVGPEVDKEVARVKATGGWVYDGRVCNVLAVSRAFGDWEFKGSGLARLLPAGVERGYWPEKFTKTVSFTGDPVIVTPATSDTQLTQEDEFLVVSTDGLWDVMPPNEVMAWTRKQLQKGLAPQQVSQDLVKLALKRKTTDNTSVVVVDLKGPEYWEANGIKQGGGLFSFFGR